MYGKDTITYRALVAVYMFWQTWLTILAGMSSAIMRLVYAIVGIIIGLPSLVFPVTPPAFNAIMLMDAPHKTFLAACVTFHSHNHPIVQAAAYALLDAKERRKKAREAGESEESIQEKARARNKRWMVLLLIKHPHLAYHRKDAIRGRLEKDMLDKELKKRHIVVEAVKGKPSKEEQAIKAAILNQKVIAQRAAFNLEALQNRMAKIQELPQGPARQHAVDEAVAEATRLQGEENVSNTLGVSSL